jgi:phosphate transport system substrate-binding protein
MKSRVKTLMLLSMLCGLSGAANSAEIVRVDTSSAAVSLTRAAAAEFGKQRGGATQISTGISGAAAALANLCRGDIAIAAVSRPIAAPEVDACDKAKIEFVEVPIAFDAVTLIVNPRNTFVESLSVDELKKMWRSASQGTVTKWKEVNGKWPDAPLKLLAPDQSSDDASYFNAAVLGTQLARQDYMGSTEDSILIQAVARDVNALAYVSLGSYGANRSRVRAVPIAGKGGAVAPTAANVASGAYQPLSRPLFLYINAQALDQPSIRSVAEFIVSNGARLAKTADLVPLNDASYQAAANRLRSRSKGTQWAGSIPVGLTPDTLQKKQM